MEVIGRATCVSSIEVFVTRMKSNLQAVNYSYDIHVCLVFAGVQLVDNGDSFHRELGRESSSCVKTSGRCRGK